MICCATAAKRLHQPKCIYYLLSNDRPNLLGTGVNSKFYKNSDFASIRAVCELIDEQIDSTHDFNTLWLTQTCPIVAYIASSKFCRSYVSIIVLNCGRNTYVKTSTYCHKWPSLDSICPATIYFVRPKW